MSKIKIRCSQCNKSFKSTNPKQQICPECEEKARRERAAKSKGLSSAVTTPAPMPKRIVPPKPAANLTPTSTQPKQHWLDQQQDVKIAAPESTPAARLPRLEVHERGARPAQITGANTPRPGGKIHSTFSPLQRQASHEKYPDQKGTVTTGASIADHTATRKPDHTKKGEGRRATKDGKPTSSAAKPKREPRPPTPPFAPTPEQITAIEQRYFELAQPGEFDGIRTQISKDLGIPKSAVKRIVSTLRERQGIPSWWDLQSYHGSPEDMEKVRAAYLPFLPLPPVGVHKQIAELLSIAPGAVYQAIKVIRTELSLPPFNPPEDHGLPATQISVSDSSGDRMQQSMAGEGL